MHLRAAVVSLIFVLIDAINSQYICEITNLPKWNNVCVAQIYCKFGITDISSKLKEWTCIRHERLNNYYNEYGYHNNRITYDSNYDLIVNIMNVEEDAATNTFGNFNDNLRHIKKITISYGNLISIPTEIYRMTEATEVKITNTKVEEIKLNNFLEQTMLNKINVSHNSITVIQPDEETTQGVRSSVVTAIDLSYNLIEKLPNNCFVHFTQLKYLNLSNNYISKFDIFTFEGITRLQSLHLSNNKIIEIGNTFARFVNLQELWLDNNHLSKLLDYNFVTISKLVALNLSSNYIDKIEDQAFQSLVKLETLDLAYNLIENFSKSLLEKNNNLNYLSLMHNQLKHLESKSFKGKNITEFYINDNPLSGTVEKDSFSGIFVDVLNLNGGKIAMLSDEAFSALHFSLLSLNLNSNSIFNISKFAFKSLELLTKLDLSNNNLQHLNFETNDLKSLSILYARNNSIRNITKDTFKHLVSLTELDLSFNSITEIETDAFVELGNLKLLILKHNVLNNIVDAHPFQGLIGLERFELMYTRTTSYQDEAFSGMTHLKTFNSSLGQLSNIGYNTFKDADSLEVLDLSHNLLDVFSINTTTIIQIKYIYLNNNLLKNVTNDTFANLTSLKQINLSNNNILKIEKLAFNRLFSLIYLDLSSNSRMEISDIVFDNLTSLSDVSLANVKNRFSFKHSNASIKILKLSLCDIEDINNVFVFKIKNLIKLNLSRNKISYIDTFSFQEMPSLTWLDLSSNMITSVQPGSFMYLNMINTLNLSANDIPLLQFGVFDGLQNLRILNLSHNSINNFDGNLLHSTPYISTVSLDFNNIKHISFLDFSQTKITKLSIGGNFVSCEILAKLKKNNFTKFEITAEMLDYNSENVNGISCRTAFNVNQSVIWPVSNNTGVDVTSAFESFSKTVEKLRKSIENFSNKTVTINIDNYKDDFNSIVKSIETFISSYNKTNMERLTKTDNTTYDFLKKLTDFSNETRLYFAQITQYLQNQSNERNIFKQYQGKDESKIADSQSIEYIKLINEKTEALRSEFKTMYQNWQKSIDNSDDRKTPLVEKNSLTDIKVLLYCIAICLTIILVIYLSNFMYTFVKKKGHLHVSNLSNSRNPIGNSIELE